MHLSVSTLSVRLPVQVTGTDHSETSTRCKADELPRQMLTPNEAGTYQKGSHLRLTRLYTPWSPSPFASCLRHDRWVTLSPMISAPTTGTWGRRFLRYPLLCAHAFASFVNGRLFGRPPGRTGQTMGLWGRLGRLGASLAIPPVCACGSRCSGFSGWLSEARISIQVDRGLSRISRVDHVFVAQMPTESRNTCTGAVSWG